MRDLVPRPGIEPGPPALGAWRLTHWTSMEVPIVYIVDICFELPNTYNFSAHHSFLNLRPSMQNHFTLLEIYSLKLSLVKIFQTRCYPFFSSYFKIIFILLFWNHSHLQKSWNDSPESSTITFTQLLGRTSQRWCVPLLASHQRLPYINVMHFCWCYPWWLSLGVFLSVKLQLFCYLPCC